ncbi:MAG: hypothetical protein ACRCTZ_01305 [Sarcina sp.]
MSKSAKRVQLEDCSLQEIINMLNKEHDSINSEESKKEYVLKLRDIVATKTMKEKIDDLISGKYYILARKKSDNSSYYIDVKERNNNEKIGITKDQIKELKKFIAYLETDDSKLMINKADRNGGKSMFILIPILAIVVYCLLSKFKTIAIISIVFFVFVYVLFIIYYIASISKYSKKE